MAPDCLIGGWAFEEAVKQRLQIESCAADEKDALASAFDLPARRRRLLQPPGNTGGLPWIEDVEEMMWHPAALVEGWFGGADVHAAIERHGIHTDDLGIEPFRQFQSQRGFAGTGRASQNVGIVKWVNHEDTFMGPEW